MRLIARTEAPMTIEQIIDNLGSSNMLELLCIGAFVFMTLIWAGLLS